MSKSGLAALKGTTKSIKDAYALIMDASISVGDQQLLLFLKVPAEHIGHALQHTDVEVADMKVATNWPAQGVQEMAEGIIGKKVAKPEYLLSDNGSNLRKAAELMDMPHHRDVSHTLATYLKQVYEKDPEYIVFSEQIGKTKHLALTDVGYLMPGRQRRMARFMNLYPIIDWAESMLDNFHLLCKKEIDKEASLLKDGDNAHNISSDIEESSFGLLKDSMPTCKMAGFTECVLRLPLYSQLRKIGKVNVSHVIRWMAGTRIADVKHWKRQNLRPNPLVRRKRALTRMTHNVGTSY